MMNKIYKYTLAILLSLCAIAFLPFYYIVVIEIFGEGEPCEFSYVTDACTYNYGYGFFGDFLFMMVGFLGTIVPLVIWFIRFPPNKLIIKPTTYSRRNFKG